MKRGSGLSVWSESSSKIKVTESMTFELLKQDLHLATVVGTRTLVLALVHLVLLFHVLFQSSLLMP